jgi:hypothetical protein
MSAGSARVLGMHDATVHLARTGKLRECFEKTNIARHGTAARLANTIL